MKSFIKPLFFSFIISSQVFAQDWRTADRSSTGIAPKPSEETRAVVQVYVARAFAWRGYFGVHPWIAIKDADAASFSVYEVVGFRKSQGYPVVRESGRAPDGRWFGNEPEIIFDLRGAAAEVMIPQIKAAIANYPYLESYRLWPGPNSNTFVSYVIRNTPGMTVELPPHAIGKDWINDGQIFGLSESGSGVQFSLFGLFGFTLGIAEGVEFNFLGMTFGIDFLSPALKLPFVGRLGFRDKPLKTNYEANRSSSRTEASKAGDELKSMMESFWK